MNNSINALVSKERKGCGTLRLWKKKKGRGKCNYKTIVLKIKKRIEEHI